MSVTWGCFVGVSGDECYLWCPVGVMSDMRRPPMAGGYAAGGGGMEMDYGQTEMYDRYAAPPIPQVSRPNPPCMSPGSRPPHLLPQQKIIAAKSISLCNYEYYSQFVHFCAICSLHDPFLRPGLSACV